MLDSRTLSELRTEVLAHGFDTSRYGSRITRWLAEAHHQIGRRLRMPNTIEHTATQVTTTANIPTATLTTNPGTVTLRVEALIDVATGDFLTPTDAVTIEAMRFATSPATGRPTHFAVSYLAVGGSDVAQNATLSFYPVPDNAYTLQPIVSVINTTFDSGDSDEPSFVPPEYEGCLISYALANAYRSEDDPTMAAEHLSEYTRLLREMLNSPGIGPGAERGPRQIPGTWSYPSAPSRRGL